MGNFNEEENKSVDLAVSPDDVPVSWVDVVENAKNDVCDITDISKPKDNKDINGEDITTDPEQETLEDALDNIGDSLSSDEHVDVEDELQKYDLTTDDVAKSIENTTFDIDNPDYKLSEESTLKILDIINRLKNRENVNVYAELPKEFQDEINKQLALSGIYGFSTKANTARNSLARELVKEFMDNISFNKTIEDFNTEMETMFTNIGTELSKMYKEYDSKRTEYLENVFKNIPEDDPKREIISNTLDSIYDSYKLTRLIDAPQNIHKVKHKDIEFIDKLFHSFEDKYKESQYNIYSLKTVLDVLDTYNKHEDDPDANKKFMIAYCKFCAKFNPENIVEHSFMYYTLYNIMLLNIYKNEDFDEFAPALLESINKVISLAY